MQVHLSRRHPPGISASLQSAEIPVQSQRLHRCELTISVDVLQCVQTTSAVQISDGLLRLSFPLHQQTWLHEWSCCVGSSSVLKHRKSSILGALLTLSQQHTARYCLAGTLACRNTSLQMLPLQSFEGKKRYFVTQMTL